VGGSTEVDSRDAALSDTLTAALDVQSQEDHVQAHVHGFHSYPARLHPGTAHRLIADLSGGRDAVLDPFCGSGTVVVEARALGRRAIGSDLNPLAVELTRLKTGGASPEFVAALRRATESVMEHARARKKAEAGPTERYGPEDRALFAPHVLLELDGLRHGIEELAEREVARTLGLVHSALLTKLSQREGDSTELERRKRLSGGFAIRFFGMKSEELGRRLLEYSALVPTATPRARVQLADARDLAHLQNESVALAVSSPPYPGVYDYYEHHRVRMRWLRLNGARLQRDEIGSRRSGVRGAKDAAREWERDFTHCLRELARVLEVEGRAALVVADSVLAGRALHAERWLPALAKAAGLELVGHAAQRRPYFHQPTGRAFGALPRREHLFVLQKKSP
jgi:hypothetical protein